MAYSCILYAIFLNLSREKRKKNAKRCKIAACLDDVGNNFENFKKRTCFFSKLGV